VKSEAARAARLVHICDLLEQSPHSIKDLALLCEVSPETITRDLVDLQLAPISLSLRVVGGDRWAVAGSDP
jgi:DeoR/GlpR family transcriptional regulator of sugar metabolism